MLQLVVEPDQLIEIAREIAPLPASVTRLNLALAEESPDLRVIDEIVSHDPALAAAVLHSANSAMYARQRGASTVRDAILRIGMGGLLHVSMRTATAGAMRVDLPMYRMESGELLDHAVCASLAAEALRRHAPSKVPAPATVAALLHDTGKLVLSRFVGARFATLVADLAVTDERPLWLIEREVFGVNHADVGVHLARHWRLPVAIVDGIVNHHEPDNGTAVAHAVHVANAIASVIATDEPFGTASARASLDALTIDPADFEVVLARTIEMRGLSGAVQP